MNTPVHIVCLDAPSPPDYGGAIEMYYKIQALAESSVPVILHYFDYREGRNAEGIKAYCTKAFRYTRKTFIQSAPFSKPHIVTSRTNKQLIDRLNKDNYPILLEGIHCTGIIPYLKNRNRNIVVRLHNDEAIYYQHLAATTPNFFKRVYYTWESKLLKQYQKKLPAEIIYTTLSQPDADVFKKDYCLPKVFVIPAFVPFQKVTSRTGKGTYCLYHGNLSVTENEAAALWLIQNLFSVSHIPLVIAGRRLSPRLKKAAAGLSNITLIADPEEDLLNTLIQQAHIHVLPDFNLTGVKLKLLHALFRGRFCITNSNEIKSSNTVAIAQTPEDYMRVLKSFMERSFTDNDIVERRRTLHLYNNEVNAKKLRALL